jgi:quinol monooxygenase YgiN
MHSTVRRYQARPGQSVREAIRRAEEGFVPIIREVPGFVAYYLIDSGDILTTVSVFKTEAEARRSVELAAKWLRANLPDFALGPPEVTMGEAHGHTTS